MDGGDGMKVVERIGQFPGVRLPRGQLTGDHSAENTPILGSRALSPCTLRARAQKPTSAS
jgi:hypothetical protein